MLEKLKVDKMVIVVVEYSKGTAVLITLPKVYYRNYPKFSDR